MTEQEFLAQYNADKYKKSSVTVDMVLLAREEDSVEVLLVKRGGHPYKNQWALPGGFVQEIQSVGEAAARELREETGIANNRAKLLGVYSMPQRDPRGWTIGIAYMAEVHSKQKALAGDDAKEAAWFTVQVKIEGERFQLTCKNEACVLQATLQKGDASNDGYLTIQSDLAFDHAKMLADALVEKDCKE